jgi:hypothetical protein
LLGQHRCGQRHHQHVEAVESRNGGAADQDQHVHAAERRALDDVADAGGGCRLHQGSVRAAHFAAVRRPVFRSAP